MNNNTNKLTREELRQKLKNKIKNTRTSNKIAVLPKQYNNIINELNKEVTNINNKLKVTDSMTTLYEEVKLLYGNNIPNPKELLSNSELAIKEFNLYLQKLITKCKENNTDIFTFRKYLNSKYTEYYIEVLGINIIPNNLKDFIIFC